MIHKEKRPSKATLPYSDLIIFGYTSKLYKEPFLAQKIDKGQLLIPCQNQITNNEAHQLMLDRYDVRHLLMDDIYTTYRKRKRDLEKEESACDSERYVDLESEEEEFLFDMDDPEERAAYIEERKQRHQRQCMMDSKQDKTVHYHYDYSTADRKTLAIAERSQNIQKVAQRYGIPLSSSIPVPLDNKYPTLEQPYTISLVDSTAQTILERVTVSQPLNVCEIQFQVRHCQDRQYDFLNRQHVHYPFYQHVLSYYQQNPRELSLKVSTTAGMNGLVDYGSSSDDDDDQQQAHETERDIILPTSDLISIIDKTAGTVAKVGLDMEQKILQLRRNDPTFNFLQSSHVYHPYYQKKLAEFSL